MVEFVFVIQPACGKVMEVWLNEQQKKGFS